MSYRILFAHGHNYQTPGNHDRIKSEFQNPQQKPLYSSSVVFDKNDRTR